MAFAFFSPFSKVSVKNLHLEDKYFTRSDVRAIKSVLKARNPLRVLLGSTETDCLVANLLEDVYLPHHDLCFAVGTTVWIISNDLRSDVMKVLVPGHGPWDISRASLSAPSPYDVKSHRLRLQLGVVDTDIPYGYAEDGFFRLAEVLGPHLNGLFLDTSEGRERDIGLEELESFVRACPHLGYLRLERDDCFFGIGGLRELYESGLCRISVLNCSVPDELGLLCVFKELANTERKMAKCLRELNLHIDSMAITPSTLIALQEMLETNRSLEAVHFSTLALSDNRIKTVIASIPPVWVEIPQTPSLDAKLAVLSAFHVRDSNSVHQALESLDREILGSIFAFAAATKTRVVGHNGQVLVS